jgi:hypothetical protein
MEKITSWFLKNVSVLNTLLILIVIALLIIDFGIYLTDKSIDILILMAAISSTFFLFLAFRESKKANDYNISQPLFEEFEHQIRDLKLKSEEDLFNDFTIKYINRYVKNELVEPHDFTFSKFIFPLKDLYTEIAKTTLFNQCIERLGLAESASIPDDKDTLDKVKSFTILFQTIQISVLYLYHNYARIFGLYKSIDQSILFKIQKQILFAKLDKLCSEYEIISTAIINKDEYYRQVICFNTFEITEGQKIIRFPIKFHNQMKNIFEKIQLLKTEGKYEQNSFQYKIDLKPI